MAREALEWTAIDNTDLSKVLSKLYQASIKARLDFETELTNALKAIGRISEDDEILVTYKRGLAYAIKPAKNGEKLKL